MVGAGSVLVLVAPHLGVPMPVYPWLGLCLCWAMLRWQGMRFADLDFRWSGLRPGPLLIGGVLGLSYGALNFAAIGPGLAWLLDARPDLSDFDFVRRSPAGYVVALALAWVIGGFYEELVFRGFLRAMLLRHLPRFAARAVLAVAITALAFAAYHAQLGLFGMANALGFALFAAAVRWRWPTNLWVVISFHACADMTAFTLMRFGWL